MSAYRPLAAPASSAEHVSCQQMLLEYSPRWAYKVSSAWPAERILCAHPCSCLGSGGLVLAAHVHVVQVSHSRCIALQLHRHLHCTCIALALRCTSMRFCTCLGMALHGIAAAFALAHALHCAALRWLLHCTLSKVNAGMLH